MITKSPINFHSFFEKDDDNGDERGFRPLYNIALLFPFTRSAIDTQILFNGGLAAPQRTVTS